MLIGLVGLAAFLWVYHRGPDQNWDLQAYHYFFGYALFHWRFGRDIAPAHIQSFLQPLPFALAYGAFTWRPFPWGAWVITALQISALPLLVLIGRVAKRPNRTRVAIRRTRSRDISNVRTRWSDGRAARVNETLWDLEEAVRRCEAAKDFSAEFIKSARSIIHTNDRRAALKQAINRMLGASFQDEKSFPLPDPSAGSRS